MKSLQSRLIPLLIALAIAVPTVVAAPNQAKWETVETVASELSDERVDVSVHDGYIYISTRRPVNVKIFTILGQLVSQASVPAGTSRFKVAARGIYILKAGSATIKITI